MTNNNARKHVLENTKCHKNTILKSWKSTGFQLVIQNCHLKEYKHKFDIFFSTSLYTDTEGDTTNSANVPRKTASKYSVDRSMIDKGNSGYDEFQHNDGKVGLSTTL